MNEVFTMGANTEITISSGRSICAICEKKIEKGLKQIAFESWNASARVHSESIDCDLLKR